MIADILKLLDRVEGGAVETDDAPCKFSFDSNVYCLRISRRQGPFVSIGNRLLRVNATASACLFQAAPDSQIRDFLIYENGERTDVVLCGVSRNESDTTVNGWLRMISVADQSPYTQESKLIHQGRAAIRSLSPLSGGQGPMAIAGDYEGNLILLDLMSQTSTIVGHSESNQAIRTLSVYRDVAFERTVVICGLADTTVELLATDDVGHGSFSSMARFKLDYDALHTAVLDSETDSPKLAIADSGGNVSVMEPDGRVIWKTNCGGKVLSMCTYPSIDDAPEKLLVGTARGQILCITDQKVDWSYKTGNCVFALDVDAESAAPHEQLWGRKVWVAIDQGQVKSLYPVNRAVCLRNARRIVARARAALPPDEYLRELRRIGEAMGQAATGTVQANRVETSVFIADELIRMINSQGKGLAEFVRFVMDGDEVLSEHLCAGLDRLSRDNLAILLSKVLQQPKTNLLVKLLTLMPERHAEIMAKLPRAVSTSNDQDRLAEKAEQALAERNRESAMRYLSLLQQRDAVDLAWTKPLDFAPIFFRLGRVSHDEFSVFTQTSTDFKLHRVSRTAVNDWSSSVRSPIIGMCLANVSGNEKHEVLISTVDGRLLAINASSGECLWELSFPARIMAFEVSPSSIDPERLLLIVALQTGELVYGEFRHGDAPRNTDLTRVGFTLSPIRTIKIRSTSAIEGRVIWLQSDCTVTVRILELPTRKFTDHGITHSHSGLPLRLTISDDNRDVYVASNTGIHRHDFLDPSRFKTFFERPSGQILDFGPVMGDEGDNLAVYVVEEGGRLTLCDRDGTSLESRQLPPVITRPIVHRPMPRKPVQIACYARNEIQNWHLQQRDWLRRMTHDADRKLSDKDALEQLSKSLHAAQSELKTIERLEYEVTRPAGDPVVLLVPCWTTDDRDRLMISQIRDVWKAEPDQPVGGFLPCENAAILVLGKIGPQKPVAEKITHHIERTGKSVIVYFVGTGTALRDALVESGVTAIACKLPQYTTEELAFLFRTMKINQPDKLAHVTVAATLGIPSLVLELLQDAATQARDKAAASAIAVAEASIIKLNRQSWPKAFNVLWDNFELVEQILISSRFLEPERAEDDVIARLKEAKPHGEEYRVLLDSLGLLRSREDWELQSTEAWQLRAKDEDWEFSADDESAQPSNSVTPLRREEQWQVYIPVWPWIEFVRHQRIATIVLNHLSEVPNNLEMKHIADLARTLNSFPQAVESLTPRSRTILRMAPAWQRLVDGVGTEMKAPLQEVLSAIGELCGLELWAVEYEPHSKLAFGLIDMESIGLRCTVDALWTFIPDGKETTLPVLLMRRHMPSNGPAFILAPNGVDWKAIPEDQRSSLAILDESTILQLLTCEGGSQVNACLEWLIDLMRRTLPLDVISPYHSGDRPNMAVFVGRKEHLETLRNAATGNAILIGPRRAGKTSILYRLGHVTRRQRQRLLSESSSASDEWFRPIYMDFSTLMSPRDACPRMLEEIGGQGSTIIDLSHRLRYLRRYENAQILFLIDEVDKLFKNDYGQATNLFWQLRGLSNENLCRFVCAGFLDLYLETTNRASSFFNFGREVFVGSLTREEANQLIAAPIERLGIDFEDKPSCLQTISYHTANHPGYIHKVCEKLIQILSKDKRCVTKDKCLRAINEVKLSDVFKDTFEDLEPLAQLILVLFTSGKDTHRRLSIKQFTDDRLQGLGCPHGMIRKAVRSAVMAGFLAFDDESAYYMQSEKLCDLVRELAPPQNELRNRVRDAIRKFQDQQ